MTCFFFPSVVSLCFSHEWLDCVRIIWPIVVAIAVSQYILIRCRKHKKSEWWAILGTIVTAWTFKVLSDNWYIRAKNNELSEHIYLISTGRRCSTHNEPGQPRGVNGDTWNFFSSFQIGIENQALEIGGIAKNSDTVLLKISTKHNFQRVINFFPSPAEIQKYMEPVLFIDGVEQPRPEYDELKLTDEERHALLREHHIEVARVVKKERDKFLRNLVTLQVNDTLQKTVNLMYKDEPDYDDIFESLNEESYVLVKVSDINPKVIEVADWQPTAEKIKKVRNQMRKPIIATIYDKHLKQVHWGSQIKRFYMVRLQFSDTITDYIKIEDIRRRQIFESLHVGDSVLIKLTEGKTKTVYVLDWQPTPKEIEKYKTPVKLIEKNK